MVLYKDRYSCLYCEIYRGSNWSVAAFSKENTFLSDIRAKEYPDGQSFLLTDANGVCVENLEEGNSMYLGETLEIEDSCTAKMIVLDFLQKNQVIF